MANLRENQIPAITFHTPAETSNSETTMQTQQAPDEEVRLTDEQGAVSVNANVGTTFPEATDEFNEEGIEGIAQDNEAESTRHDQAGIADRVTDVRQSSASLSPSMDNNTGPLRTEPTGDDQMEGSVSWLPSVDTNTGPLHTEPIGDYQTEVSVSSGSSWRTSTSSRARWIQPVVNVLNWTDHALSRRPRGVRSFAWQHGYRAGIRSTLDTFSEHGLITEDMNLDALPEPLFSNSPPAVDQRHRTESVRGHVDVVRRETTPEHGVNSDTVSELDTNAAEPSASATPTRMTQPFVVLTTTPGRPRVTSILSTSSPPGLSLEGPTMSTSPRVRRPHHHLRYSSAPLVATNQNPDTRPSRSSMMEYAKATEDINDMKRFGDEEGADEVVPGGLVRGSPLGGYPKRRSSVLRRVNVGRRERGGALYLSGLTQAVEEENRERMTEMLEDLGTGAERSGGIVRKLLQKGKKRLSKLFN